MTVEYMDDEPTKPVDWCPRCSVMTYGMFIDEQGKVRIRYVCQKCSEAWEKNHCQAITNYRDRKAGH